jgi:MFS superfamily sulfate permease-like transporter
VADNRNLHVELRGGYYFGQLERLIRDLQPLLSTQDQERGLITIDLSHLVFMGPTAMELLLATVNRFETTQVHITPPSNPLTHRYFLRSDFVRLFIEAETDEPFSRKNPKVSVRALIL